MIPFVLLAAAPFVAEDAGLSWAFDGAVTKAAGHYDLKGKELRGEVAWFVAPKGRFDAESLYKSDTQRTKEADASKGFTEVRAATTLAGMPAIRADQWYKWNDVPVSSRCVYAASGHRAWVVRLWWSPLSKGEKAADALLKSIKLQGGAGAPARRLGRYSFAQELMSHQLAWSWGMNLGWQIVSKDGR